MGWANLFLFSAQSNKNKIRTTGFGHFERLNDVEPTYGNQFELAKFQC